MKMSLGILALAAALAAHGGALQSGNALGIVKVASDMGATPLAVPFAAADGTAKTVAQLVSTNSLAAGDQIIVYDAGIYTAVTYDGEKWTAGTYTAKEGEAELTVGDPAATGPAPGTAFWLVRTNDLSRAVYLAGSVPASYAAVTVTASPMLLASPKAEPFAYYAAGKISGAAAGDRIVVPQTGGAKFISTFDGEKWMYTELVEVISGLPKKAVSKEANDSCDIPTGIGFWYIRASAEGDAPTVTW